MFISRDSSMEIFLSFFPFWRGVIFVCDQIDIVELRWSCSLLVTCPESRQNMPRSVFFIILHWDIGLSHSHSLYPLLSVSHWFFPRHIHISLSRFFGIHDQKPGWVSKFFLMLFVQSLWRHKWDGLFYQFIDICCCKYEKLAVNQALLGINF